MKMTAKERRQYLEEVKFDFFRLMIRMANLQAMDFVNRRKRKKASR